MSLVKEHEDKSSAWKYDYRGELQRIGILWVLNPVEKKSIIKKKKNYLKTLESILRVYSK